MSDDGGAILQTQPHSHSLRLSRDIIARLVRECVERRTPGTLSASREAGLVELGHDLGRPGRAVGTSLSGREARPDMRLYLLEGRTEGRQVAFDDRGEDPQHHQAAKAIGQALGDRREFRKGPQLVTAMQAMPSGRLDDEHRPFVGEVKTGQQGRDASLLLAAAVDQETPAAKTVQADAGAVATSRQEGQLLDRGIGLPASFMTAVVMARLSCVPTPRPTCSGGGL